MEPCFSMRTVRLMDMSKLAIAFVTLRTILKMGCKSIKIMRYSGLLTGRQELQNITACQIRTLMQKVNSLANTLCIGENLNVTFTLKITNYNFYFRISNFFQTNV
jgi:hypothetical protein